MNHKLTVIKAAMEKFYGKERGDHVFYGALKKGTIVAETVGKGKDAKSDKGGRKSGAKGKAATPRPKRTAAAPKKVSRSHSSGVASHKAANRARNRH